MGDEIIKTKQCVHTFKISIINKVLLSKHIPRKEKKKCQKGALGQKTLWGHRLSLGSRF